MCSNLSGNAPVIKVALKGNYAPNVFVSVLAVRGRVSDVQPTALVDLGKPAFKMGVAEINVGWRAHELGVKVSADKEVYKVRDKARVSVQVTQRAGGKAPKSGEVAIAVVDEGLLELLPNDSWKLLDAMMQPRGIEVNTSTASMQVVGKRHYGRKALAQGGGGGRQTARELFDTLLLWKAKLPLDEKGRASFDIPLNDSLTSFRIIAVADSGIGLFGTGQTSIRTTQDLMLLSGLPPLIREGDRFDARFTVRNASQRQVDCRGQRKCCRPGLAGVARHACSRRSSRNRLGCHCAGQCCATALGSGGHGSGVVRQAASRPAESPAESHSCGAGPHLPGHAGAA